MPNVLINSETPKCSAPIVTAGDHIAEAIYTVVVMIIIANNVQHFLPNDLPSELCLVVVGVTNQFNGFSGSSSPSHVTKITSLGTATSSSLGLPL